MAVYHDEVEIEDFDYDEEEEMYYYPCPCGDRFQISKVRESSILIHIQLFKKYISFLGRTDGRRRSCNLSQL